MKKLNRLMSAALAVCILLSMAFPALAAGETIYIKTAEDLAELSKNCTLDSWSRGKMVVLQNDIDLKGRDFTPIPTFGGTFDGQGHRIYGLVVEGSGNVRGLFRYIQKGAVVRDLRLEGDVSPSDRRNDLGILAGSNSGQIINCTVKGRISGESRVGGIAGINEEGGEIVACTFEGTAIGVHSAGGIAGENRGTLTRCVNTGSINTKDLEDSPKTDYTNLDKFNSMDNVPAYTDIGGIAGLSGGVIQSCRNEGAVGYEQIGYNIGGIAGRQSGYLDGCENSGKISGNKDVGGIVGQLEPEVVRVYGSDTLTRLLDELENLQELTDRTIDDARSVSHSVSDQLDDLSDKTRSAKDIASELSDAMTDWANGNIDQINELSARVSWAMDRMSEILDSAELLGDDLDDLIDELEKVRDQLVDISDEGQDAAADFKDAAADLKDAASSASDNTQKVTDAMQKVIDAINAGNDPYDAIGELIDALNGYSDALDDLDKALGHLEDALGRLEDIGLMVDDLLDMLDDVGDRVRDILDRLDDITGRLNDMVTELSAKPEIKIEPIGDDITSKSDALWDALDDMLDSGDQLNSLLQSSSDRLLDDLRDVNNCFKRVTSIIREEYDNMEDDSSKFLEDRIKDHFTDVSDSGNYDRQHDGRVSNSVNTGDIYALTNAGGIAGSIGIETDIDVDEDIGKVGDYSLKRHYEARGVLISSSGKGVVTSKNDNAGGVCGAAYLGLIYNCGGYAEVESTDGSYVGGIAGCSDGTIRGSWVRCTLSGGEHIGGVAGYGNNIEGCRAVVSIPEGGAYTGAVAGEIDKDGLLSGNLFASDDLGGVDGISYEGKAEPSDYDRLCTMTGVPDDFKRLELVFRADGEIVEVISFRYGKGIDHLPEIPAKKGCSASWPDIDYTHLTAAQTLDAVYTPYSSSLAEGGSEIPMILVDGSFSPGAEVSHTSEDVTWTDEKGNEYAASAYTVSVSDPELKDIVYTVHFRLPDSGKKYDLWIRDESGSWSRADSTVDGSYLLFKCSDPQVTFSAVPRERSLVVLIAAAGGAAAVILLLAVLIIKKRAKRKRRG